MNSAVVKHFSIGVLLPSFSLSNVVDVNEHDDCTNDILCDINVASAAVRHPLRSKRSSSLGCLVGTWQKRKSNNSEIKTVTESSKIREALDNESRVILESTTETCKMIDKLNQVFDTDTIGEIGKLNTLVDPQFVTKLEKYQQNLFDYKAKLLRFLRMIPGDLKPLMEEDKNSVLMLSDLMLATCGKLNRNVKEVLKAKNHNQTFTINGGLKTDIVEDIRKHKKISLTLPVCIKKLNDNIDLLIQRMTNQTGKPECQTLDVLPKAGTSDCCTFFCLLALQNIIENQYRNHLSVFSKFDRESDLKQSGKHSKDETKRELLNVSKHLYSALKERTNMADKILKFIMQMGDTSIDKERREEFNKHFDAEKIDAFKIFCDNVLGEGFQFEKMLLPQSQSGSK